MRRVEITDPYPKPRSKPESIKVFVTFVDSGSDHWGDFEVFRGSSWSKVLSIVSGDSYSHALHGRVDPLLRELSREPQSAMKKITPEEGECLHKNTCIIWNKGFCVPGGKDKKVQGPPDCYEPPLQGASQEIIETFSKVALALKEGYYIVVVKGSGFNFF